MSVYWDRLIRWPRPLNATLRRERELIRQEQFRRDRETTEVKVTLRWDIIIGTIADAIEVYLAITSESSQIQVIHALFAAVLFVRYARKGIRLEWWNVSQKLTYKWERRQSGPQTRSEARRDAARLQALIRKRSSQGRVHQLSNESAKEKELRDQQAMLDRYKSDYTPKNR